MPAHRTQSTRNQRKTQVGPMMSLEHERIFQRGTTVASQSVSSSPVASFQEVDFHENSIDEGSDIDDWDPVGFDVQSVASDLPALDELETFEAMDVDDHSKNSINYVV